MPTAPLTDQRVLAARTLRAYASDWALFTDWCHTTGHRGLPADPGTVVDFLAGCPAAPATLRRRVAAIDHQHTRGGHHRPGDSVPVRAALGRPTRAPHQVTADTAAAVDTALRSLPSHGWTRGMFGRRDRCLLVLSTLAGVPYRHLARLTVGDITVRNGTATIRSPAGEWTVRPADADPVLCGPCAVTRWVRALDLVISKHSNRPLIEVLKTADPVTEKSPHLCRSTRPLDDTTRAVPLLPPIDQWGYVPFPLRRLTPHSLSRRVRDLLAGDLGAHREYPVEEAAEAVKRAPVPVVGRAVYSRDDWQQAWSRRRADLADIAGVSDVLNDIDTRAAELERRTAAILAAESTPQ